MSVTINGDGVVDVGGNSTSAAYVRLYEDADNGTNYVDVIAPSLVTSNKVITLPDSTTTVVGTDTTQTLTNKTLSTGLVMNASAITSGTSVSTATTSFTASISGTTMTVTAVGSGTIAVVVAVGSVMVQLEFELGEAMVNVPVPLESPLIAIFDNFLLL